MKAYPNPSTGMPVTMDFVLNASAKATLDIMTVSGARVARLFEGDMEAGVMQTATFDRWVTEGLYVYVLRWNDQMITGKVIVTK